MNFRIDQLNYLQIADISISHHSSTSILNDDVILSWELGIRYTQDDRLISIILVGYTVYLMQMQCYHSGCSR